MVVEMGARLGIVLLLALAAGGCGMKGDLYYPEREVPAATPSADEPDDEEAEGRGEPRF